MAGQYNIVMDKPGFERKKFSESTGKLHMPCAHKDKTGITIHVVIKDGTCYKSGQCLVVECKYNRIQDKVDDLISLTW
jgi:translation initiation factor IF-2